MRHLKLKLCPFFSVSGIFGLLWALWLSTLVSAAQGQPATAPKFPNQGIAQSMTTVASATRGDGNSADLASPKVATADAPLVTTQPPRPLTPPSYLASLESSNIFDSERKMWPDKRPPVPPPPPPPAPPPVTDKDLQLYGVVIVGQTKRATIKVGSRFAQLDTQGRGFVSISEGQALGDWVLAEIHPTHLVLGAPGGRQTVLFNKKTDRVATAGMQPQQTTQATSVNEPPSSASVGSLVPSPVPDANVARGTASTSAVGATAVPPVAPENTIKNAQPGSLAAAISAAQAAAAASPPSQNVPPPANFNPFLQLFPKQ